MQKPQIAVSNGTRKNDDHPSELGVPHFVVVLALIFQVMMGTHWWDIKPGTGSNGSGFG